LIVVSDTSPILNLARIGRLELLQLLYHQILIPDAVYRELTDSKRDLPPAIDLTSMSWLMVVAAANQNRVQDVLENLDPGEAEAIVLAIELRADLLLVDERRGRRNATAARSKTHRKLLKARLGGLRGRRRPRACPTDPGRPEGYGPHRCSGPSETGWADRSGQARPR
jgi:predicted nucleic acid-binding protein